ncbi:MAG: HNH endonuclease [Bryobacteraceae bacterium]
MLNADLLHRYGREANVFRLLTRATQLQVISPEDAAPLSIERQRVVQTVSRLSRLASFRRQVLFAHGNRCAVTSLQLRLVEAAHILPVGAPGSSDNVRNGISLSVTYHRAYDNGSIYLNEEYEMKFNKKQLPLFSRLNLTGGLDAFRDSLGKIFLPPDRNQWPSQHLIRRANRFRQVH